MRHATILLIACLTTACTGGNRYECDEIAEPQDATWAVELPETIGSDGEVTVEGSKVTLQYKDTNDAERKVVWARSPGT